MAEASPPSKGSEPTSGRNIALGGLKRAIRSRRKSKEKQQQSLLRRMITSKEHEEISSEEGSDDDEAMMTSPLGPQRTSNHYTLNMSAPPAPPSEFPNVLLGYVCSLQGNCASPTDPTRYLQFFWNLSLIILVLYLVVQFILTVQRDVEHRISEYSSGMSWVVIHLFSFHHIKKTP
jgi:hypothetical protein